MRASRSTRRKLSRLILFIFAACCLSYTVPGLPPDSVQDRKTLIPVNAGTIKRPKYVEGEVLVKFRPNVNRQAVDAIAEDIVAQLHAIKNTGAKE